MSVSEKELLKPVEAQLKAYNSRDLEAYLQAFSQNCVVENGSGEKLMCGRGEMAKTYGEMFERCPNLHATIVWRQIISAADGNYVVDAEQVLGRQGADSDEITHAVAIYRIENGLITRVRFVA